MRKNILILCVMIPILVIMTDILMKRSQVSCLSENTCETAEFREQHLSGRLYEELSGSGNFADDLTVTMLHGKFSPDEIWTDSVLYRKYKPTEYFRLRKAYQAVWFDLKYFPIADNGHSGDKISFENTYGAPRTYGGQRIHEGCDLFGEKKQSGYYPVLSMTDGTVEKIGWLPLGGYRIGIRASYGGYFYYAHLSGYEKEFKEGDPVEAGEILGYMGNTGYGEEGTAAMFQLHLHLGIYIETPNHKELSVNPYWVLKAISKKIRNCSY